MRLIASFYLPGNLCKHPLCFLCLHFSGDEKHSDQKQGHEASTLKLSHTAIRNALLFSGTSYNFLYLLCGQIIVYGYNPRGDV